MIIAPKELLRDAQERHYAIPAFNFYNLDGLFAVLEAAEEEQAPIIVEIYHVYYPFLHQKVICSAVQETLRSARIHAYLHLDHATDQQVLMAAIKDGFQSVMVDGSTASLEENIAITKQITTIAKENGVYTEAEVGHVARVGTENSEGSLATVADCVRLTSETGVDSLAAAVGTAHGIYQTLPKIDFQRIREIHNSKNHYRRIESYTRLCNSKWQNAVKIPLVLHGGSGIPDEAIQRAILCGISKINIGTELKYAWSDAMKKGLLDGEKEPRILSAFARMQVKAVAKQKIRLLGATGKDTFL